MTLTVGQTPPLVVNVDDHDSGRYVRTAALRRAGYEVIEAASGLEALALVAAHAPALVLLDVRLPDVSGFEICRRIKAQPGPSPLVLLVSALEVDPRARADGLNAGADGYLTLPAESGELLAHVGALLRLHQTEARLREREERLALAAEQRRVALEIAQLGTWEYDVSAGVTRLDARAAEILGLPAGGVPDDAVSSVIHPDDRERVRSDLAAGLAPGGGLYESEYRVLAPGGERHVATRGRLVQRTSGRGDVLLFFVGTVMDVTAQKQVETTLRNQTELLAAIIDHIPVLLTIWDPALQTFRFNKHLRDVLGWSEADAADGRFMERVYPDPAYRDEVAAYMRSLAPGWRDLKTTAKDGTALDISWANVQLSGGVSIGIGVDVRNRKAVEDAMARVNQQLADADRRKDEFIALLAHELRNPLAPVRSAVAILRARGPAEPVLVRCRDVIDRQVGHMARLLDDLLDVSRLARGKLMLQPAPVLLKDVLDAALEISRPLIEQHDHEIAIEGLDPALLLEGDAARLTQVFGNLLNNAAKYSARGARIALSVTRDERSVTVEVRDPGIGIDASMLDRIFELFTQGDETHPGSQGGLGIGLSLARRLVELHGGTLTAASAGPGQGSTFTVRLPLAIAGSSVVPEPRPHVQRAGTGRRVLIADDNVDSAEMLATLFELAGCDIRKAYDGLAAVTEAEAFRPELVLLDIGMPGLDGYQACARMRTQAWAKNAVIVAVTGWGQEQDRGRSAAAGFDRHLVKPVEPDALLQLVVELPSRS